jgi:hypothetical protein
MEEAANKPRKALPYVRALAIAAALFLLYLLLGFLAGPPLVKRVVASLASDTLQRKATVGEVRVNPLALSMEMRDFAFTEKEGAPIAAFRRLYVNFQLSSLFRRAWTFGDVDLEGLDLRADIAPDGRFNIAELLASLPKRESRPDSKPPRVLLQRLKLSGGTIGFSDRSIPEPASAKLAPLDLEVHELSTIPDAQGNYAVSVRLPAGGTVAWKGEASLQPLASHGEVSMQGLKPDTIWDFVGYRYKFMQEPQGEFAFGARYSFAYGAGGTQLAIEGMNASGRGIAFATSGDRNVSLALASLDLSDGRASFAAQAGRPWQARVELPKVAAGGLEFADRTRRTPYAAQLKDVGVAVTAAASQGADGAQVALEGIGVNIGGLSAGPAGGKPFGTLASIAVEGGKLDLAARRFSVARVKVEGGELAVVREKDGSLPLLTILAPSDEGVLRQELAAVAKDAKAAGAPWNLALDELQVSGMKVAAVDHSFGAPIAYDVRDLKLALQGYATDAKTPVKFDASLALEQGGSLTAAGTASGSGEQAELRARLERISLKPLAPALASRARVALASGDAFADLKISYRQQKGGKPGLRLGGTARIDNFLVNEADGGERLLAWKSIHASGLSLGLAPDQLKVEEARVDGLGAKIVVYKDRSTNLAKAIILKPAEEATAAAPAQAAVTTADTEALFPVTVDRVRLNGGIVDFADLSLVLPFGTKVHELGGLVEHISTDRASRATVKLEGRVDEYGLARAEGSLRPFKPTAFMDLAVLFRNVDMPPLSPYTATFAGRRIDSGKLSLDLRYKINEGQLAGENRVVLEKFTLGEKVQSEGALDLPLDLAVALLTDSDGKIDLSVPVAGDVNDPRFDYGAVVWQAVKIVLTKIVTAPFRALASLFGGGSGESYEAVVFDPGRAALLPPEQEKLKQVAAGLSKRPQIRLVAEGSTGPADRTALQQRDVAVAVAARLGQPAPARGAPAPTVNVTDAKTQRALEALFVERNSDEALAKFAADTGKARGKEVERANAALALVGRGSADHAFYEALLKRLNDTARVPDEALTQLADERARAVATHMTAALAFPPERASARTGKPGDAPQVRLELETAAAK